MIPQRPLLVAMCAAVVLQALLWVAVADGVIGSGFAIAGLLVIGWALVLWVAVAASRQIDVLTREAAARQDLHRATLDQVEQLGTLNEMLMTMGRSKDVGLTFQGLARRVGRLIPCDRLGLALIKDNGRDLQTYTSRVSEPERRRRPRPEVEYNLDRSVFGQVVRTCEPALIDDLEQHASEFQDATALSSQGFRSALILPLISRNRAIGALMVLARQPGEFSATHRDALQPLAEVLAFAYVVQQQHDALDKFRAAETLAEMSLSLSAEISSALQAIIGQCGVIGASHPAAAGDVAVLLQQAERMSSLLERLRGTASDRISEAADAISGGIPTSPEALMGEETL